MTHPYGPAIPTEPIIHDESIETLAARVAHLSDDEIQQDMRDTADEILFSEARLHVLRLQVEHHEQAIAERKAFIQRLAELLAYRHSDRDAPDARPIRCRVCRRLLSNTEASLPFSDGEGAYHLCRRHAEQWFEREEDERCAEYEERREVSHRHNSRTSAIL